MTLIKYTVLGAALALLVPTFAMAQQSVPADEPQPKIESKMDDMKMDDMKMEGMKMEGMKEYMHKKGEENFSEADTNKDGVLSLDEFLERHKTKFAEIDTDKNNALSPEEMKAYGESMHDKRQERRETFKERRMDNHDSAAPETAPAQ